MVSYIVRAIDSILKSHFNLKDGLASVDVTLLDPARWYSFLSAEAISLAAEEYKKNYDILDYIN